MADAASAFAAAPAAAGAAAGAGGGSGTGAAAAAPVATGAGAAASGAGSAAPAAGSGSGSGAAAGATGAAGAGTGATGGTGSGAAAPAAGFLESFPEAERARVAQKGWTNPAQLLASYDALERLAGVPPDQLVRLPKPGDADSARQFWTKVGAGEKPEDYKLEVVQGAKPEDVAFIQGLAHKHMLPKEGVAAFVKEFDAEILKRTEAAEKAAAAEAGREYDAQIAAWGSAATANVELGRRALAAIGWNEEQARAIQGALGVRAFMEGMVKIGQGLAEHGTSPTGGKPAGAVLSPADAQAEIKRLKADPTWSKNYLNGGAAEKAEMDRLHKLAYPTGAVGGGAIVVGGQAFARP